MWLLQSAGARPRVNVDGECGTQILKADTHARDARADAVRAPWKSVTRATLARMGGGKLSRDGQAVIWTHETVKAQRASREEAEFDGHMI